MTSKYLGKVYDGFEVVNYYLQNKYKKQYASDSKATDHRAYNYELYNTQTQQHLTLSGNQLRMLEAGKRSIPEMLKTNARASKNKQINAYLKWVRAR